MPASWGSWFPPHVGVIIPRTSPFLSKVPHSEGEHIGIKRNQKSESALRDCPGRFLPDPSQPSLTHCGLAESAVVPGSGARTPV